MSLATEEYIETHRQEMQRQAQIARWLSRNASRRPGVGMRLLSASGDGLIALGVRLKRISRSQAMASSANLLASQ
jgi:hypothetical protein